MVLFQVLLSLLVALLFCSPEVRAQNAAAASAGNKNIGQHQSARNNARRLELLSEVRAQTAAAASAGNKNIGQHQSARNNARRLELLSEAVGAMPCIARKSLQFPTVFFVTPIRLDVEDADPLGSKNNIDQHKT